MPLYTEVVAALKSAAISPEDLFCQEYTLGQESQVQSHFPHCRVSLRVVDYEENGGDTEARIFCFNGHDQDTWLRVKKYTGGGGGAFDEATFEHVLPVQTTTYERYPTARAAAGA